MSNNVNEQPAQQNDDEQAELAHRVETEDAEAHYRFEHADGTIATAETVEKAKDLCPVLGGMATEQAKVLLELSKIGASIIEKREPDNNPKLETTKVNPEDVSSPANPDKTTRPKEYADHQIEANRPTDAVTVYHETTPLEELPFEKATPNYAKVLKQLADYEESLSEKPKIPTVQFPETIEQKLVDESDHRVTTQEITEKPADFVEDVPLAMRKHSETMQRGQSHKSELITEVLLEPETNNQIDVTGPEKIIVDTVHDKKREDEPAELHDEGLLIVDHTEVKPPNIELERETLSPEAYAVFSLIEEIENQRAVVEALVAESETSLSDSRLITNVEQNTTNTFEAFISQQPVRVEPFKTEEIHGVLNSEPLENGLIILAELLTSDELDKQRDSSSRERVEQVHELIDVLYAQLTEQNGKTGSETVAAAHITPEITQHLLDLLRVVGYKEPDQVLLTFMEDHDTRFMFDAISYLHQLQHTEFQQEFVQYQNAISATKTTSPVSKIASTIGHVLLSVMQKATGSILVVPAT